MHDRYAPRTALGQGSREVAVTKFRPSPRATRLELGSLFGAVFICLCVFAFLFWRASLPNTRDAASLGYIAITTDGAPYALPRDLHLYDDALTQVTAHNFARDGFRRSHGLPNRRGAPRVSLYDVSHTQCEPMVAADHVLVQWNGFGQRVQNIGANNDCVHIHYPPLADWIFALFARLGGGNVHAYKILAILVNCSFLFVFFWWLGREVPRWAALGALAFAASVPAFLDWADALYFHSFQFLFLACATLAFSCFLESRRPLLLRVTWVSFFCEALVSPELTLALAIILTGLGWLSGRLGPRRAHWKGFAALGAAPIAALSLQFALSTTLFGVARVFNNLKETLIDRASHGPVGGFSELVRATQTGLLPAPAALLALLLVVVSRRAAQAPLFRSLALLGIFAAAAVSFSLVFPGMAAFHASSVYRHFWPLSLLLVALLLQAWGTLFALVKSHWVARLRLLRDARAPGHAEPSDLGLVPRTMKARADLPFSRSAMLLAGCFVLCSAELAWLCQRGVQEIGRQVHWSQLQNLRPDTGNLVRRALDVIYWTEGVPRYAGLLLMPVIGLRANEQGGWLADFRIVDPRPSHYEIWWLRAERIARVQLLVDDESTASVSQHCSVSWFDGQSFHTALGNAPLTISALSPAANEVRPAKTHAWVRFALPPATRAQALRVSCAGAAPLTLHQIEAFSS